MINFTCPRPLALIEIHDRLLPELLPGFFDRVFVRPGDGSAADHGATLPLSSLEDPPSLAGRPSPFKGGHKRLAIFGR
jgi:hypothetical protein